MITLNSGHTIPTLGIGTWKSDPEVLYNAIKHAITVGYRHIDCAWRYQNEEIVGNAINDCIKEGIVTREELFITSKLWNSSHHPDDVENALQESLKNLQLDYLDLYLIHWPIAFKRNVVAPTDSESIAPQSEIPFTWTWSAMEKLVEKWLIKSIWVSNFSIKNLETLLETCSIIPAMNQIESHPFLQQDELISFCQDKWINITAYAQLGSMDRPPQLKVANEPILLEHPVILEIAKKHNTTPAGVLIGWAIWRNTIVIPKSTSAHRIEENLKSAEVVLDKKDYEEISKLNLGFRFYTGVLFPTAWTDYTQEYLWG